MGALLAEQFSPTLRNLTSSFEARLVQDIAGNVRPEYGLFFAALGGTAHGNFDVIHDPQATDQIVVAQLQSPRKPLLLQHLDQFSLAPCSQGSGRSSPPLREFQIEHVRIDATIGVDLRLTATTTLAHPRSRSRPACGSVRNSLAFDISRRVRVPKPPSTAFPPRSCSAKTCGPPSCAATTMKSSSSPSPPVSPPANTPSSFSRRARSSSRPATASSSSVPAAPGIPTTVSSSRTYELTFRCPKHLSVIATGDLVEERVEGDVRITRRRSLVPLRIAGFNLGEYKRSSASRGGLHVDVYANKAIEAGLAPRRDTPMPPPPAARSGASPALPNLPAASPSRPSLPDPAAQIEALAAEVAEAFEFLAARFGPPPLKTLAVSPIPGTFGQGFPGLIYLSTLAYLHPRDRPQFANQGMHQVFFSDILVAHEVAHQWWGNTITTAGYRDEWMMEALANYSALLLLERKRGARALEEVLESYRDHLLAKGVNGQPIDSAGPIQSRRPPGHLRNSRRLSRHRLRKGNLGDPHAPPPPRRYRVLRHAPRAAHPLPPRPRHHHGPPPPGRRPSAQGQPRPRPGAALRQLRRRRRHPRPRLQIRQKRTARGIAVAIDLDQTGVDADFAVDVPVDLDFGRGKTETRWIRTDGERATGEWTCPPRPSASPSTPATACSPSNV